MRRVLYLTFGFTIMLNACRPGKREDNDDNFQKILLFDATKTVIIPLGKGSNYPFDYVEYGPATLTQEDMGQIEAALIESVTEYNDSLSPGHEKYKMDLKGGEYKKQLVAARNSKGEKEVWVNCFCDDWNKTWRTQVVLTEDGGPCYFHFKINLTKRKVYDFVVNGFA